MSIGSIFLSRKQSWPPSDYISRCTLLVLESELGAPPQVAWRRRLNSHANLLKEFTVSFKEALKMIHLGFRLWSYIKAERSQGRTPQIDPFTREIRPSACHGVPLGGIGAGSIGRGFRGEFRRWQFIPGVCEEAPVVANQFSVFVSRDGGKKKYSSVLYPGRPQELGKEEWSGISSWDWNLDGQHSTYHALFPRAWTIYEGEPDPDLTISCRQISPFIPHNYRESSLPSCVFSYTLVNTGRESATVSLLFTWTNSIGGSSHLTGGHFNEQFIDKDGICGVLLHHKTAKGYPPVRFAIASQQVDGVTLSVCPCFSLSGKGGGCTAKDVWCTMIEHGSLSGSPFSANLKQASPSPSPSPLGEAVGAAIAASVLVQPHEKKTVSFSLAWDSPEVKFSKGSSYNRRYTTFYGISENVAAQLAHDALLDYPKWERAIESWQDPVLKDGRLPEWYRFTLFNELYYLVAGGTVWTDGGPSLQTTERATNRGEPLSSASAEIDDCVGSDGAAIGRSEPPNHLDTRQCGEGMDDLYLSDGSQKDSGRSSIGTASLDTEDNQSRSSDKGGYSKNIVQAMESAIRETKHGSAPGDASFHAASFKQEEFVGRFLYLEGIEYIMWCTYDVHFYSSFALLALFPKLELSIQREFAAATLAQNSERTKFLAGGKWGIRKVLGAVPHDLGTHNPWLEVNAYNIHDTSRWKDLNSKFVLQVYRDVIATGDMNFAESMWPAVFTAMAYMDQFDRDRDGLIENDGFPDQTYDTWTVHGISAYCGGLWLAALQAAAALAEKLNHKNAAESFRLKFHQARDVYEKKLWNGSYFNYDSGTSSNSHSIMADQMAGQWYAWASGLSPLFENNKIQSALQKIYDFNVMKVKGGKLGAVNGMHPDGKVDKTCMQSREIWTGVTYAVSATMIHAGMIEQAFTAAGGVFQAGWSDDGHGYWFQTPEGWTTDGHYRSLTYMRPLAIWAMQWALDPPQSIFKAPMFTSMDRASHSYLHMGFSVVADTLGNVPRPQLQNIRKCFTCLHKCNCK